MPQHWIIAPVESEPAERFEKVWQFDLGEGVISIGWTELGDVSRMSKEELSRAVATAYPEKPAATKSLYTNMVWAFHHEIAVGDLIIARRGRKILAAVGEVKAPAYYFRGKNPDVDHPNFLPVQWRERPRDVRYPAVVFPMHTLAKSSREQFEKLIEGVVVDPPSEITEIIQDPNIFVLEKYLEEFIVSNFTAIFQNKMRIYTDADGNFGQQYSTEVGPIDILAKKIEDDTFVVIELKKGRPSDQVVGQVLRYMGWVKEHLCKGDQPVMGLIICKEPDNKLSYALKMIRNVDVAFYWIDFKLKKSPQE